MPKTADRGQEGTKPDPVGLLEQLLFLPMQESLNTETQVIMVLHLMLY